MKLSSVIEKNAPRLLLIGIVLEIMVLALAWIEAQSGVGFFQSAARLSGRVSLLFFSLVFIYSTLYRGFDQKQSYFQAKYKLIRDFAIVHVIHWCLLAVAVMQSDFELVPFRVAGGALAYFLVVAMPFLMGRQWLGPKSLQRLQSFYLFWVWLIFFLTYVTRLKGQTPVHTGTPAAWWPLAVFCGALMVWRVAHRQWSKANA